MFFSRHRAAHSCSEHVVQKEERGAGGTAGEDARASESAAGGKSDEDVFEVIIMDDSLRKLLPDLVILIEIEGVQWLETATCERSFSLRTQILTVQRYSIGDSLLACLMMMCSNGPSLNQKEEVEKFLLSLLSLRDSRLSRREYRPGLLQENDPRVRLHPAGQILCSVPAFGSEVYEERSIQ
jgi:hypothetical protein